MRRAERLMAEPGETHGQTQGQRAALVLPCPQPPLLLLCQLNCTMLLAMAFSFHSLIHSPAQQRLSQRSPSPNLAEPLQMALVIALIPDCTFPPGRYPSPDSCLCGQLCIGVIEPLRALRAQCMQLQVLSPTSPPWLCFWYREESTAWVCWAEQSRGFVPAKSTSSTALGKICALCWKRAVL